MTNAMLAKPIAGGVQRTALLLLAILAFGWHSFLTQTHFHPGRIETGGASCSVVAASGDCASHHLSDTHRGKSSGDDGGCLLCHEMAMSGLFIAPTPISFTPPVLAALWQGEPAPLVGRPQARSHIWQSRAPPHFLQS